jgi:hypothetical protein
LAARSKKAGVVVENVARESLAARRTPEQKRDLAVGHRLLAKVVVADQSVLALVAVVLPDGAAGVGRDVLQGGGVGGAGADHAGVFHGAVAVEHVDDLGHGGFFLAHRHINAFHIQALLVDDGVNQNCGLADLPIADHQLALAAANRGHGVDRL